VQITSATSAAKETTQGLANAGVDAGPHQEEHTNIAAPLQPSAAGDMFGASCSDHMQINKLSIK